MSTDSYLTTIKRFKKCWLCKKKKSKILISQIIDNGIRTLSLCIPCFKKEFTHYTTTEKCFNCDSCFKCNLQKTIFTPKEIKQLKIKLIYE